MGPWFKLASVVVVATVSTFATGVLAQQQNECARGQGTECGTSAECEPTAPFCVGGACQVLCEGAAGSADPLQCTLGESCILGTSDDGDEHHYCRPAEFTMDLNLLDSCVYHFVEGIVPDLSSNNQCSLARNLNTLLDRDGRPGFNIYDLDACVKDFLAQEPCDVATASCPDAAVFCQSDAQCGNGLHCNTALHKCERECGLIVDRANQNRQTTLDRECAGYMQTCDYTSGRCVDVELDEAVCQVDDDCPNGAYCFLGQCTPRCYRTIDCPDSNWFCSRTNQCLPVPKQSGSSAGFDPKRYSVQFATQDVRLDLLNDRSHLPILIMDLATRKPEFANPNVVFGYRVEVKYSRKQTPKCAGELSQLSEADRKDCLIEPDEEFVQLDNPFGTVFADGAPKISFALNRGNIAELTPGVYQATVNAIFNNGSTSSATVSFAKTDLGGQYDGHVSTYLNAPTNALSTTSLAVKLNLNRGSQVEWDTLLGENGLSGESEFRDITRGHRVTGCIDGNENVVLNNPSTSTFSGNCIPVKGIYAEDSRRMRLIGVIDIAANACWSDDGQCGGSTPEMTLGNAFQRPIRRVIELLGPYDDLTRSFSGMFRDTISGLAPHDVTVDGGFRLQQTAQDEAPVHPDVPPSLVDRGPNTVAFPAHSVVLSAVESEINATCPTAIRTQFASQAAFDAYMQGFDASGPILSQLIRFEERVSTALSTLSNPSAGYLTLADYFRGQIRFCSPTITSNCVDQQQLRCGLAVHRKAVLSGWVDVEAVESLPPSSTRPYLFCVDRPGTPGGDCPIGASAQPDLVALQEHNRFYREFFQTATFQANGELSDAFYTLYKAANGEPMGISGAYAFKEQALMRALGHFNQAIREVAAPASTAVLFAWPMRAFASLGDDWIDQMHAVMSDRSDALLELLDLRRRVLSTADQRDFVFIQHALQQEYLHQVLLAVLQEHWQEEQFDYRGQGPAMTEKATTLAARVSDSRNPLGLHPNRVYFENSNTQLTNWQNYKERIKVKANELDTKLRTETLPQMKGVLTDRDGFVSQLLTSQQQLEAELDNACGSSDPLPVECDVGLDQKKLQTQCVGPGCLQQYRCEGNDCDRVVSAFSQAANPSTLNEVACRADVPSYTIISQGVRRPCVRGRVGALLQERVAMDAQRNQTFNKIQALIRSIAREQEQIRRSQTRSLNMIAYLQKQKDALADMELKMWLAEQAFEEAKSYADTMDCMTIVGLASGTDCIQSGLAGAVITGALVLKYKIMPDLKKGMNDMERLKEIFKEEDSMDAALADGRKKLDDLVTDIENLIFEYELQTQQLFNTSAQIQDALYGAQRTADRHRDTVDDVVGKLIGRESGSVVLRNALVQETNETFKQLLVETYKMAQAFTHRYNLDESTYKLQEKVFSIVSVADILAFVSHLEGLEHSYCGSNGLDCDAINNREIFVFSVRDQLFPDLRPVVDPDSGQTLSVSQQFHNIITSPTYLKRRKLADGQLHWQIELPFAIWLNQRGDKGGAPIPEMVTSTDCNHVVAADRQGGNGTLALNAVIRNNDASRVFSYEVWRGGTDYIRACEPVGLGEQSRIISYSVGWAPSSSFGQSDEPPLFFTQSGGLSACVNSLQLSNVATREQATCYHYFARDRSLAAPDWKIVIPFVDFDRPDAATNQKWILGENKPATVKPVVEDLVLYVRYNKRPI